MKKLFLALAMLLIVSSSVFSHEIGDIYLIKNPIDHDANQPREVKIIDIIVVNSNGRKYLKIERCSGENSENCFNEWVSEGLFDIDIIVKLPKK